MADNGSVPDWPWRELNDLAKDLIRQLVPGVRRIMAEAGEDPADHELFKLRCCQVAYGIHSATDHLQPPPER